MATKTICDCPCGKELADHDAGRIPVIIGAGDLTVEIRVHPRPGGTVPHIRPSCLRELIQRGEQLYPPVKRVVDPAAVEGDRDLGDVPDGVTPLRAAGGE